jgi:hypothetical protein
MSSGVIIFQQEVTPEPTPDPNTLVIQFGKDVEQSAQNTTCGIGNTNGTPRVNWSIMRDYPSVTEGTVLESLPYDTPVTLLGKYFNAQEGLWWWHVRKVTNLSSEGWIREDAVNNDNPDTCSNTVEAFHIPPPPPPAPCEVRHKTTQMTYFIHGITDTGSQYLISELNVLPQQWISVSTVEDISPTARSCDPGVLGVVQYHSETESSYMNALSFYANNFLAPVNREFYTNWSFANFA